jgi:hypothetical protein
MVKSRNEMESIAALCRTLKEVEFISWSNYPPPDSLTTDELRSLLSSPSSDCWSDVI